MAKTTSSTDVNRTEGKFVWLEVHGKDPASAAAFYPEVIGWKRNDMDMGDFTYQMFNAGDGEQSGVAGIGSPAEGAPPHWLGWVSVADVDAATARVKELGGSVISEPVDMPVGRFSTVADPEGAVFHLFKNAQGDAPDGPAAEGQIHWMELWARDAAPVLDFYKSLLGYTVEEMEMPNGKYFVLNKDGAPRAGVMTSPDKNIPPMWLPYIRTEQVDDVARRAKDKGGDTIAPPSDIPGVGRIAHIKDPEGAVIGIIRPAPQAMA